MVVKIIQKVAAPVIEQPTPQGELLTPSQAYRLTNLSKSYFERLVKAGVIPPPVRLHETPKYVVRRYRRSDLQKWMDALPAIKPQVAA